MTNPKLKKELKIQYVRDTKAIVGMLGFHEIIQEDHVK